MVVHWDVIVWEAKYFEHQHCWVVVEEGISVTMGDGQGGKRDACVVAGIDLVNDHDGVDSGGHEWMLCDSVLTCKDGYS